MVLNSKGQVTIPAHLRHKYDLHVGDEVEVIDVGGTLQIVRAEGAETRGQRLVRRLRNTGGQDREPGCTGLLARGEQGPGQSLIPARPAPHPVPVAPAKPDRRRLS